MFRHHGQGVAAPLPALAGLLALFLLVPMPEAQGQLPVGSISDDVAFALFEGNALSNGQLSDFAGQIVVSYYYTPW